MIREKTDVLVIGCGGAGCRAALAAGENGTKVLLVGRNVIGKSGLTPMANGGYQTVWQEGDSLQIWGEDICHIGCELNDPALVDVLTENGAACLDELASWGADVRIKRDWDKGKTDPAQRFDRTASIPGKIMLSTMKKRIAALPNVRCRYYTVISKLLVSDGKVCGAVGLDLPSGETLVIQASAVILAAGGMGAMYECNADEPQGVGGDATGSGIALALDAGARAIDLEMIQFATVPHEPALVMGVRYVPPKSGDYVVNADGVRFATKGQGPYSNILAREIIAEYEAGRGPVRLLPDELPYQPPIHPAQVKRALTIAQLGVAPKQIPLEVTVGPLYSMGGVEIHKNCSTTLSGLFAAGEVAGGMQGAQRSAGTSLTEIIVFGKHSGESAAAYAAHAAPCRVNEACIAAEDERLHAFLGETGDAASTVGDLRKRLAEIMTKYVGVNRNGQDLLRAKNELDELRKRYRGLHVGTDVVYNLAWIEAVELGHMLASAEAIVLSAYTRQESRGAHYRSDFPERDDANWLKHVVIEKRGGELCASTREICRGDNCHE